MECDLDGRFASIRSKETNLGNLVADIMLDAAGDGDFALLNSGTLRSDRIHPKGPFKMRDLVTILPYMESILVLNITGKQVHRALENGVSQYPKLEGRFPQVAGITFAFDPTRDPGSRVPFDSIHVQGSALLCEKVYRVVTKEFIAQGKVIYLFLIDGRFQLTHFYCHPAGRLRRAKGMFTSSLERTVHAHDTSRPGVFRCHQATSVTASLYRER